MGWSSKYEDKTSLQSMCLVVVWQAYVWIGLKQPISLGWDDVDGSEIPNDHLGSKKTLKIVG